MNTQLLSETKSSLKASPDLEDTRYGAITQGKNTYTYVYKKLGVKEGEGRLLKGDGFAGVYGTYVHCTCIISHTQK